MAAPSKIHFFLTRSLVFFYIIFFMGVAFAKEGLWIPATLKGNEKDMRANGLKIPADKLYNDKGAGLNNAVVLFGRGCTGEIISPEGLLLTNHHCGYGSVQRLAGAGKDYFENGFWAKSRGEELPCPGLTVTFTRKMENVTDKILAGASDILDGHKRDSLIAYRCAALEKEYAAKTRLEAVIKPFFDGNQYWVSLMETYRDIRLVGFPPNGIGAFGGDVENWEWPRHTGDFSIFRIYAGDGNKPADYSEANTPYHTEQFFKINISGYKEGDFTMVYGFPGTTHEYIPAQELKLVSDVSDPISVFVRTRKLEVWDKHMASSRDIFLKYTSKRAGVANGWKKWKGEMEGLKACDVAGKKQNYEDSFYTHIINRIKKKTGANLKGKQDWAANIKRTDSNSAGGVLLRMTDAASLPDRSIEGVLYEDQYIKECPLSVELIQQGAALAWIGACFRLHLPGAALQDTLKKVAADMGSFFKDYDEPTDKDLFTALIGIYFTYCWTTLPDYYKKVDLAHRHDVKALAEDVYENSLLTSKEKLAVFAANATPADSAKVWADPAWQLYNSITTWRSEKVTPILSGYYSRMHTLDRLYMKAQMAEDKHRKFYPDANLTLRLSYGKIKGLDPDGPAPYSYQTTLRQVIALDDTTADLFRVPARLKQLYHSKDFGRWAVNGDVPVAFVATNHTTGGNSGSPVLNARGELIGINFDRASEGVMSDYYFTDARCRNISVDIRYVLFIIEKFGNAGWLLDEMTMVKKD